MKAKVQLRMRDGMVLPISSHHGVPVGVRHKRVRGGSLLLRRHRLIIHDYESRNVIFQVLMGAAVGPVVLRTSRAISGATPAASTMRDAQVAAPASTTLAPRMGAALASTVADAEHRRALSATLAPIHLATTATAMSTTLVCGGLCSLGAAFVNASLASTMAHTEGGRALCHFRARLTTIQNLCTSTTTTMSNAFASSTLR